VQNLKSLHVKLTGQDIDSSEPALTPEVAPLNVCAATARRLLEIARRTEIRREAKLPLLPVAKELRRIKRQEDLEEFERFQGAYARAVWEKVLKPRREAEGNPNWRPNWMEGVSYQTQYAKFSGSNLRGTRSAIRAAFFCSRPLRS
jgi:uncharacterized protein HemY